MNSPSCILLRGVNWIGDAVMTMPAVQRLQELWPESRITILGPEKLADLWQENPAVHSVRSPQFPAAGQKSELAIVFPHSFRSALDVHFFASHRVGYAGHWPRKYLLTDIVPEEFSRPPPRATPPLHMFHYLGIVKFLGGSADPCPPKIHLRPDELASVASKFSLSRSDPPASPLLLALCPGAEYGPAKRWLPDRFAEVARRVRAETNCRWILVGSTADKPICDEIAQKIGESATNLSGKTTLRELCALLAQCKLLLTNDTGPMHLAAAVGTRVVALFGSTDPLATGPYGDDHVILRHPVECSPCLLRECPIDFRCMNRISSKEVTAAVLRTANEPDPKL